MKDRRFTSRAECDAYNQGLEDGFSINKQQYSLTRLEHYVFELTKSSIPIVSWDDLIANAKALMRQVDEDGE